MTYIEGVDPRGTSPNDPCPLDRERGRTDDRSQLKLRLFHAPSAYLEGALDNPELGPEELAILLRNQESSVEIVARIGRNRAWMRARAIQVALVANPRAPQLVARRFLPHLTWRDLAEVAANLRLSPVVRREAEKLLGTRLPELALGEKVALARRGSRGVVDKLRDETDPLVLRALAGNPRTTETDLARVLARMDVPSDFLAWLADRSSWSQRRSVRLALVRHPRTPASSALRLTRELSRTDIDELRRDVAAPRLVRVAAERLLSSAGAGSEGSPPYFG